MRIVGGKFRGRPLVAPKGRDTRPTSDRVREAVFNKLLHSSECPDLEGAKVIDLFAGTGAQGLEAMSRGAQYVLFVEIAAEARGAIRQNIETLGLQGVTRIFRRDATDLGPAGVRDSYAFAFLDPPYGKGLGEAGLKALADGGWLADGAVAVLEERSGIDLDLPEGFEVFDQRDYGDTTITYLRYSRSASGKAATTTSEAVDS